MPRPRIAIPTRLAPAGRPRDARRRRLASDAYCEAVAEAGGEPVRLAAPGPCAGLLIPGGPDFAPPEPRSYPLSVHFAAVEPEQLALDRSLLAAARAERRPVLGVCYGMQLIALECGGSLHYDLATDVAGRRRAPLRRIGRRAMGSPSSPGPASPWYSVPGSSSSTAAITRRCRLPDAGCGSPPAPSTG